MLSLTHSDYTALRAHGEETYPYECCGVLLGTSTPEGNAHKKAALRGCALRLFGLRNPFPVVSGTNSV